MLPGHIMPDSDTDDTANPDCIANRYTNIRPKAYANAQASNANAYADTSV